MAELRHALVKNRDIALEITNYRRDGTAFVNNLFVGPVYDADGRLLYRFGSQLDVTEVHRNRRRLAESEERQRAIFNSASEMAIVVTDAEGRVTDWNVGSERILGWSAKEMHGQVIDRIFTPEDLATGRVQEEMAGVLRDGHAEDVRWHLRKDGSRFYAVGDMTSLRGADGTHRGFVKAMGDRTEQRNASVKQQADAEFMRGVLASSGDCIKVLDLDGSLTFMSEGGMKVMEVSDFNDVKGCPWPDFWQGEGHAAAKAALAAAKAGGAGHFQGAADTYRGTPRWWDVQVTPIFGPDGRPEKILSVSRDITEQKSFEVRLAASEARRAATVELGDRLRDANTVLEMATNAAEIVGRTLKASRAGYGELDATNEHVTILWDAVASGEISIVGRHRFADYGAVAPGLGRGDPFIVYDTTTDPRTAGSPEIYAAMNLRAMLNVPVQEHGRTVGLIFAHSPTARVWAQEEIAFARNVADRVQVGIGRLRAEERQVVLNHELSHRMKNLLAMVQSIASQTMRAASDVVEARDVLSGRLIALGKAHDLLLGGSVASTRLAAVVRDALKMHQDQVDRFEISGPDVDFGADQALAVSLSLHELATNAAKYGALTTERGRIAIEWALVKEGPEPSLRLTWVESGGPAVRQPTRKGFGSRFLERALAAQVGGGLPGDRIDVCADRPALGFSADRLKWLATMRCEAGSV